MISTSYQKKTRIIYVIFKGNIDLNQLFKTIDGLNSNRKYFNKKAKTIFDFTNAEFDFNKNLMAVEIYQLRDYVSSIIKNYTIVNQAIVVNDINNNGLEMFYLEISKTIENYNFKIFDNIEAAENWLVDI